MTKCEYVTDAVSVCVMQCGMAVCGMTEKKHMYDVLGVCDAVGLYCVCTVQ